jgi:signal transduction histidine kinase
MAHGFADVDLHRRFQSARETVAALAVACGTPEAEAKAADALAHLSAVAQKLERQAVVDEQLTVLGEALYRLASLDFSRTLDVRGDGSILDGIRGCVNMLAEELGASHRELVEAKLSAERAAAAKGEFVANMSHELRTPMHAILNYADMALGRVASGDELARSKLTKYLTNIRTSGTRLLSLIDDLLDLSRLESGKTHIERSSGNFMKAVKAALQELEPLFKTKTLQVTMRQETIDLSAWFDTQQMIQVLDNVLANAARFAAAGSAIELVFRDGGGTLLCGIRNDGPCIPDDELEAIFDKFVQSRRVKSGAGGTGLGLSICRAIMTAHEGRIWAENVATTGVCFYLELPRQATAVKRRTMENRGEGEVEGHVE